MYMRDDYRLTYVYALRAQPENYPATRTKRLYSGFDVTAVILNLQRNQFFTKRVFVRTFKNGRRIH